MNIAAVLTTLTLSFPLSCAKTMNNNQQHRNNGANGSRFLRADDATFTFALGLVSTEISAKPVQTP